jgi:glycosyltransferase involved in cell wall biosynthesis
MERPPVVIPNGIDPKIFRFVSPEARPKHATWNLLYAGQLIKLKRVDLLLKVLAKLPSNVELSLAYHVADLEATLKAQARALGIARRVHFLGAKSARELAKLYQESDLFVLPSSGEALPSVVAEAMFCGTPVVATQVGGISEQMGRFGLTVPANDIEALAGAIEHVLTNYPTYAAQAEEMSSYARARASIDVMVAKHLELYSELAAGKHSVREHRNFIRPWNYVAGKGMDWLCRRKCRRWSPPIAGHRRPTGDISN